MRVTEHLEKTHGIKFDTIDPLNEPNTNYWGTKLGPDGQPIPGTVQEGAHAGPALQAKVILALKKALANAKTKRRHLRAGRDEPEQVPRGLERLPGRGARRRRPAQRAHLRHRPAHQRP